MDRGLPCRRRSARRDARGRPGGAYRWARRRAAGRVGEDLVAQPWEEGDPECRSNWAREAALRSWPKAANRVARACDAAAAVKRLWEGSSNSPPAAHARGNADEKLGAARDVSRAEPGAGRDRGRRKTATFTIGSIAISCGKARWSEGRYLLSTNRCEEDPASCGKLLPPVVAVEEGSRTQRRPRDRPVCHQIEARIEAHISCLLGLFCTSPLRALECSGAGVDARSVLEKSPRYR